MFKLETHTLQTVFTNTRGDPLGGLNVSPQGLIQRDDMIFEYALNKFKAPIVMTLGGGYSPESAQVIVHSLMNLKFKYHIMG